MLSLTKLERQPVSLFELSFTWIWWTGSLLMTGFLLLKFNEGIVSLSTKVGQSTHYEDTTGLSW